MAARRLIIVLVVLFAISIAAAAVAPQRRSAAPAEEETTTSTTQPESLRPPAPGGTITDAVEASVEDPETVRASVGDQLELVVSTGAPLQVELPDLGLLDEATPDAPARFNVLLRAAGDLEIVDADRGDVIGRLLVDETSGLEPEAEGDEGVPEP